MTMESPQALFLIVDDEPDMCWALEHLLKENGQHTKTARNGRDALQLLRHNPFSLVFLDAKLPDIDGLALARQIKGLDPATHIVMISGFYYRDDGVIQQALAERLICGFISKPYLHKEIMRTLEIVAAS
jgi:CheY-like chemotaxis protein